MEYNPTETEPVRTQELNKAQEPFKKTAIKISFRTAIIIAIIIAFGVLGYFYKGLFIAASVDGSLISRLSIIQKLEKASGKNLLDSLITEKLIESEAKSKGIVVNNEEVDAEIKTIQDKIITQGSTIDEALAAQGMNINDLKKQIKLQKEMEKL